MACSFLPDSLRAAPKDHAAPSVESSVAYDASAKVLRGGSCEVSLRSISPHGYDVKFEIVSPPRFGSLTGPQRNSKASTSFIYTHDGNRKSREDSFRFKCKSGPQSAWGYGKAVILVEEPPPVFSADVSALDFGSVFLGESRTLPLQIRNTGGGRLEGLFKASPPWKLVGPGELSLAEGESRKILVTFEPVSTDTQRGSLVFESGFKPFREITLAGVGEFRFEAPEIASFEQRVGAQELRIPVKNRTAAPLPLDIHCPQPLEAPSRITLPPGGFGDLVLGLPARPFAEKSALVTLGDGIAARDLRIQLPPSPSLLEWKLEGKSQLGPVTPERVVQVVATLRNIGGSATEVSLRTQGEGLTLASSQAGRLCIQAMEGVTVRADWKLPVSPGSATATLVAETEGLPPFAVSWEAEVQPLPGIPEVPPPVAEQAALPSPTPPKVLTAGERDALAQIMPRSPSYRLVADLSPAAFLKHLRTATAIISWSYEGSGPVEFVVERQLVKRRGFFDKNPFDRTLPTVEELPERTLEPVWTALEPSAAKIEHLASGRWQVYAPGLSSGYHKFRILARRTDSTRVDGVDFNILVGDIPLAEPLSWLAPAILLVCAVYLLRNKIRGLFG
ncbi:MAG: hypothetical protein WCG66_08575 [bacterium]